MSKKTVLQLNNICRDYIQGRSVVEVLKNINLTVLEGELVSIIGASGSGKSTLLHIAGLLDTPDKGNVKIVGTDVSIVKERSKDNLRLTHIGFIYQNHHLLKDFSARENVAMPRLILGSNYHEALEEADILLTELGLGNRTFNLPGELSGGEQQRVAIARAIINRPQLILADEPTGNLDPHTADDVFNMFMGLSRQKNIAVVMVTHNHQIAEKMDKIFNLNNGRLELVEKELELDY